MVAQTLQISNQILIDMKNIYELKDIIEFSGNSDVICQEIIDSNP